MADVAATSGAKAAPMTGEQKKVIFASSLGTIFEWYDFYLYGSLGDHTSARHFFRLQSETTRNIFALLAFAAGFLVRPFGALVFGRLGDLVGRKYTFLVTIVIMGRVDLPRRHAARLPRRSASLRRSCLSLLRMLQGLALGGEYGGAATYVAEHAPDGKRGLLHLLDPDHRDARPVPVAGASSSASRSLSARKRSPPGAGAFRSCSRCILLGVSVWIRLQDERDRRPSRR